MNVRGRSRRLELVTAAPADEAPRRRNPWPLLLLAALLLAGGLYAVLTKPLPGRLYSLADEARVRYGGGHATVVKSGAACTDCHRGAPATSRGFRL